MKVALVESHVLPSCLNILTPKRAPLVRKAPRRHGFRRSRKLSSPDHRLSESLDLRSARFSTKTQRMDMLGISLGYIEQKEIRLCKSWKQPPDSGTACLKAGSSQASKPGKEKQISKQDNSSATNYYHQYHNTNAAARQ